MHRFFVPPRALAGDRVTLNGDQARQIAKVLRLHAGERIGVLDGQGQEYLVELTAVQAGSVQGRVESVVAAQTEPTVAITLMQSLLKAEKFEWVLQKGTELGIAAFTPVSTERSIVPLQAAAGKTERWSAIIREAAEQSHRGRLPELREPDSLAHALQRHDGPVLIPWEAEDRQGLRAALERLGQVDRLTLVIGPEGGFSSQEVAGAVSLGAVPVSLGPRILRAETAGLVAATAVLYHYHELGG